MQSIVSYPDRGVGGKSSYRGNCSPRLISDLIDQFGIQDISDYMCGSGTTEDVARQRGITSHCYEPLLIPLRMTVSRQADIRDLRAPTWKDVLVSVMRTMHGPVTLDEIYRAVEGHGKARNTKFWQEKIRQTLYVYPNVFRSVKRGAWELTAT